MSSLGLEGCNISVLYVRFYERTLNLEECQGLVLQDEARQESGTIPKDSKYPICKDFGPKSHQGYGFWDQRP